MSGYATPDETKTYKDTTHTGVRDYLRAVLENGIHFPNPRDGLADPADEETKIKFQLMAENEKKIKALIKKVVRTRRFLGSRRNVVLFHEIPPPFFEVYDGDKTVLAEELNALKGFVSPVVQKNFVEEMRLHVQRLQKKKIEILVDGFGYSKKHVLSDSRLHDRYKFEGNIEELYARGYPQEVKITLQEIFTVFYGRRFSGTIKDFAIYELNRMEKIDQLETYRKRGSQWAEYAPNRDGYYLKVDAIISQIVDMAVDHIDASFRFDLDGNENVKKGSVYITDLQYPAAREFERLLAVIGIQWDYVEPLFYFFEKDHFVNYKKNLDRLFYVPPSCLTAFH